MRLPRELATGFRPHTGLLAKAVVAGVAREVPEYTAPMAGPLGHIVSATLQAVFLRTIDAVVSPTQIHARFVTLNYCQARRFSETWRKSDTHGEGNHRPAPDAEGDHRDVLKVAFGTVQRPKPPR